MITVNRDIALRDAMVMDADSESIAEQIRAANDPLRSRNIIRQWSSAAALNRLGLPLDHQDADRPPLSLSARLRLYENIGYVSPALIFLAPGPGMAAYVVAGLGSDQQQARFFSPFRHDLHWSCFAMTEPDCGSDARAMKTTARRVDGGFILSGEKMLIGNGTIADTGVVFARTAAGALGVDAFMFNPQAPAVKRRRLRLSGLEGISLAQLTFEDLFVPDEDALGQHLKPTQRFARSALATFDNLRPCVGALALGVARRALHDWQAQALPADRQLRGYLAQAWRELNAAYLSAARLCRQLDEGQTPHCTPGMSKTTSVNVAETLISRLIHHLPADITDLHHRLWRAFRDVKAFEYTEGTRHIHLLSHVYTLSGEEA